MIRQLIRNKVFDGERLLGTMVVAIDGSGHVSFGRRHCPHCLTQTHGDVTSYFHEVLEAKRVTSSGLALSMGSEFIDNRHFDGLPEAGRESRKQDCELKAFARLAAQLKRDFPQLRLCLAADALMTFGPVFQACKDHGWRQVDSNRQYCTQTQGLRFLPFRLTPTREGARLKRTGAMVVAGWLGGVACLSVAPAIGPGAASDWIAWSIRRAQVHGRETRDGRIEPAMTVRGLPAIGDDADGRGARAATIPRPSHPHRRRTVRGVRRGVTWRAPMPRSPAQPDRDPAPSRWRR